MKSRIRALPAVFAVCWVTAAGAQGPAPAAELPPEIRLPPGFRATVFHPGLGRVRHIAVRANGDVYVARPFQLEVRMFGQEAAYGALIALRDTDGDGVADLVEPFGPTDVTTEVAIRGDYLYFSSDVTVYRLRLGDALVPTSVPEPVAGGFPIQRSHGTKTLAFDGEGHVYVNVGVPSNVCEAGQGMRPEMPGLDPCPQLERSGGIWRFKADRLLQDQVRDGERFVTGTRNVVAMAWNPLVEKLYFVMHGRDSLGILWPKLYTREQNQFVPAEEFHVAEAGDDFGWPYSYYDPVQKLRLKSPEYGGDGQTRATGKYKEPLIGFPAHWAPNDLIFHSGQGFPERYRGGAFIAFHGSWNRIPFEQAGYNIVFVPLRDGRPLGTDEGDGWEVFADGFAGPAPVKSPADAAYRPTGLAEGPDGALYISEDKTGRIWRVTYAGD